MNISMTHISVTIYVLFIMGLSITMDVRLQQNIGNVIGLYKQTLLILT
jgi:hypothetical protein